MKDLTYFARISECDPIAHDCDAFSFEFPDLPYIYSCAEDREAIIAKAKSEMEDVFNLVSIGELNPTIYAPSTLEELEAEADRHWDVGNFSDEEDRDYVKSCEIRYEFVPITVTPPENILSRIKPHPRHAQNV